VLEAATTPQQPWRPLFWRDAALAVAGSILLALLAMWLVELFNRSEPQPTLVIAQSLGGPPYPPMPILSGGGAPDTALPGVAMPLLAEPPIPPRELRHEELAALIRAGADVDRVAMLLLLNGVGPDSWSVRWRRRPRGASCSHPR
jgi:hypothetical protein